GRARMLAVTHRPPADDVRPDAPVHLVTGRVLQHYQSGAQTRRVPALAAASPGGFVELHPDLAARLDVTDGDLVAVRSSRGTATAPARVTDSIRPDTVFMPFHWSGPANPNAVTNDALDPTSRMPELKVCAVEVSRA
ncbi:MAG: nitrite reductase, partial [Actinobacteria bacterium]|nr:nitrite reductase [Actinomycetota bacterium]